MRSCAPARTTTPQAVAATNKRLSRLEQQDGHLTHVEIDEVFRLVSDVRSEVAAHAAVPRRVVLFVEFLLDVSSYIFLYIELLHGLSGALDSILLHIFGHVCILDYCL